MGSIAEDVETLDDNHQDSHHRHYEAQHQARLSSTGLADDRQPGAGVKADSKKRKVMIRRGATVVGLLALVSSGLWLARPSWNSRSFSHAAGKDKGSGESDDYDLSSLSLFRRVLLRVADSYVDPKRIDPRQMLVFALHAVEKEAAEVIIHESLNDKGLIEGVDVRIGDQQRSFNLKKVNSPWALSAAAKEVFQYLQPRLTRKTKIAEIEYAAINGMLSTLDPHSLLLSPEVYGEMKLSTRGEFGGLGIVISMVQGKLTVINPMKGTPAYKAGLKPCDQIVKIGKESTVNMTLSQAVQRLRGKPGSTIAVTLKRKGRKKTFKRMLKRDIIKVDSVNSRMLSNNIGYVRLKSFQGNTYDDMKTSIEKLESSGMKGLVLDLRGNPGGLLDQAIKISDYFVDSGVIVSTVSSAGKKREEKRARKSGTRSNLPLVVLVSNGSASASEIVAGAIKNLDRGVIVGRTTFGKGSVQVLYDNDDDSALKLTIAQYLTPGDVSIQSVGITPDILTKPVVVRPKFVRLRRTDDDDVLREEDLDEHLTNTTAKVTKPHRTVRYFAEKHHEEEGSDKEEENENLCFYPDKPCKPKDEDSFYEDFQIRFAKGLLKSVPQLRRSTMLRDMSAFISETEAREDTKIEKSIADLGINWKKGGHAKSTKNAPIALDLKVNSTPAGGTIVACKKTELTLSVTNTTQRVFSRLAAKTHSVGKLFSGYEFPIGRLAPGESKSWTVPLSVRDAVSRMDRVRVDLSDEAETVFAPYHFKLKVEGVKRPVFAYSYQLLDAPGGNGDGMAQKEETLRLWVSVRNVGDGVAHQAVSTIKNLSGTGIFINKGRHLFGMLKPGESKTASFKFNVESDFDTNQFKLELSVFDQGLREIVTDKLKFPVVEQGLSLVVGNEQPAIRITNEREMMRSWPSPDAPVVGYGYKGDIYKTVATTVATTSSANGAPKAESWIKVAISGDRSAFIPKASVDMMSIAKSRGKVFAKNFREVWQVSPPTIQFEPVSPITDGKFVMLDVSVDDESRVMDTFIYVYNQKAKIKNQKVFYRSNAGSANPKSMRFSAKIPISPGSNYISVFARENEDVRASKNIVVYRNRKEDMETTLHSVN